MRTSQVPPLTPFKVISTRLHTPQSLAWSGDGELAVAADDSLHVYLPHFRNEPRLGEEEEEDSEGEDGYESEAGRGSGEDGAERPWFLRKVIRGKRQYSAAPLRVLIPQMTDPRVNQNLLAKRGAVVNFNEEEDDFMGVGVGVVTGFGSALNQAAAVQWSPSGLGPNSRPIVTALLTKGMILAWGEMLGGKEQAVDGGTRDFRYWKMLWGLGGSMPLPEGGKFSVKGDKVKAFSWAGEIGVGRALLGYHTDADELVVMAVQYVESVEYEGMNSDGPVWRVDEVLRVKVPGPHVRADVHDPDYVSSGSAFSVKWSPWISKDGTQTAVIAYIAPNYIGFRRVTLEDVWERGKLPKVRMTEEDTLGICCHLSSDAFIVWEDAVWDTKGMRVCRGVIATPFTPKVFEIDMLGQASSIHRHRTLDCKTVYPLPSDTENSNPITGIAINPPPPHSTIDTYPVPIYTLTRLSATSTNKTWYQHNNPSPPTLPTWATTINKLITSTVPESQSYFPIDSASDSSATEAHDKAEIEAPETNEHRLAPRRVRLWALAQSPGRGATAVLFSKHSALMPDRVCRSRVAFGPVRPGRGEGVVRQGLSAEGRAWEWMYGGGGEVPGFTEDVEPPLGDIFREVRTGMKCALCKGGLELEGGEFVCTTGHVFARCATSSLPILSPATSRTCSLCGRPNLLIEELLRLAGEYGISEESVERVRGVDGNTCSACGGKFVV